MQNKTAIVTGGGSGIGLAIAKKFTEQNLITVIVGRDENKLQAAKEQLGRMCHPFAFDLSDLPQIPGFVENIFSRFGSIDILVNNAGINFKKDFVEVTDEEFERVIKTNLTAVFSLSREVVKKMIMQNSGSIVNISSMAAHYGLPRVIGYSASKTAIEGVTRALAVELATKGVRVNCIAPGFITTDMTAKALNSDPERKNKALSRTPMGMMGETIDIAEAAYFLASDAAKYITGSVLTVDGGNSIGF